MADKTYDAIIVGAGIMGASTAFQLARRGLKVAILEKGAQVAAGSTGQSSAVVRQRYANVELVQLAYWGVQMFHNWCDRLELTEDRSGFSPVGVVWLTGDEGEDQSIYVRHFEQVGVAGGMLPVEDVRTRYPSLNLCTHGLDMSGAEHDCVDPQSLLVETKGGYADPQGTTEDLIQAGINKGVALFVLHQVTGIQSSPGSHTVTCANGESFSSKLLLNASGPWCHRLNEMVGVELPMKLAPVRVQIASRDRPAEVTGEIPVFASTADQIYARPEANGTQLIAGSTALEDETEEIEDPDNFDADASLEFRERTMHKLHHRLPMKSRGSVHGYAALYAVNIGDRHPIIDAMGPKGYFVANGFSGHGFKLGPAMGALIARMMTGIDLLGDPTVDASYFSANRNPITSSGGVLA